ncbi:MULTISPECIES: hypothetical protein [Corynebacterium]|uniref:Uncharacterized protein n=1 Tax=Corynebacterium belfantii TaxID=2014537 RepID=A0ABS0LBW2_9CORY|nr:MULTISPECIES: hypothetical protein [Corynebacterium]MBG9330392.1 hypothetical protein [Corynebacterium belfantii]MBG9346286.1 hypothetical protein [Corynebacterium belfantii]MBG9354112.1 hypothetical protein [Corynebacterium belfantii]
MTTTGLNSPDLLTKVSSAMAHGVHRQPRNAEIISSTLGSDTEPATNWPYETTDPTSTWPDSDNIEVAKLKAALAAGIDPRQAPVFADLLKGSSQKELARHAEELKKFFNS